MPVGRTPDRHSLAPEMSSPSSSRIARPLSVLILVAGVIAAWLLMNRGRAPAGPDARNSTAARDVAASTAPAAPQKPSVSSTPSPGTSTKPAADVATGAPHPEAQPGDVIVSLGKVEDVARRAAAALGARSELAALTSRDRSTLTGDEKRRLLELQRDQAAFLGMLPEIAGFQDDPDEYARFFRTLVQQAAGASDSEADAIQSFMRQRGVLMRERGLNAGNEPDDPGQEEAWEERRDAFNEETVQGLRAVLPQATADKAGLTPQLMEFLEMDFDKAE